MKKIMITEHAHWESTLRIGNHHYAKLFSENNWNVFYLSSPLSPIHLIAQFGKYTINDLKLRIYQYLKGPIYRTENLITYIPFVLSPVIKLPFFDTVFNSQISLKTSIPNLQKILIKNNFIEVDVLFMGSLQYIGLLDIIKAKKIIYRMADNNNDFPTSPKSFVENEKKLIQRSDHIIVVSKQKYDELIKNYNNIHYVPNGVSFNQFNKKLNIKKNKKKVVYVGSIHEWFDWNLIKKLAFHFNKIEFDIYGPIKSKPDITLPSNVKIYGPIDFYEVPRILQMSQVGIIPFKNNKLVSGISPIKLYEYFAAGLPVVSTFWKEIYNLKSPAFLAKNSEEFIKYLKIALNKQDTHDEIEFAFRNSWEFKFNKIVKLCQ
jgi:teichuronic acid biosynthesis glycosyltransferase TuaH